MCNSKITPKNAASFLNAGMLGICAKIVIVEKGLTAHLYFSLFLSLPLKQCDKISLSLSPFLLYFRRNRIDRL